MSNERKPLVTMADVRLHCGELNEREAVACRWIIERYERLIESGKLRVVEEVEAMCGDHGGIEGCSCSKCSAPVSPDYWMYCPGCGNPIKR